ncbi:hypothetical protein GXP67_21890 [Rhodocytophaga rosea]|uniref:Uncharacterized protein n=1 Tax=Rhodocytophaga rosea TaxID=2704465 RepID=A0A6C0GM53_9BACT|nr:hypothetical protein [Rhodocytophaga rosea]QHT69105.1 hypothetical protein GXP67_21890 [Rhodocytophaga rosea]
MKKNYLRLPFMIKIILLTALLLAGKFSRQYTPQYSSDFSAKTIPFPDSLQVKSDYNHHIIEYVNWASER